MYTINKVGDFYEVFNTSIKQTVYVSESFYNCVVEKRKLEKSK